MNVLLIDNYDSFTYNLAHDLKEVEDLVLTIVKNDEIGQVDLNHFEKIIISPGPGLPKDNGTILDVILSKYKEVPILGVCLGLQAIYEVFGGELMQLPTVHHGVSSEVKIMDEADVIFKNIQQPFLAGRYHSWVCDPGKLPDELKITAVDQLGTIMACRHASLPVHGIQFHPESILTPEGKQMLKNFIRFCE